MWEPQPLATLRASTACTGITLPYLTYSWRSVVHFFYGQKDSMRRIVTKKYVVFTVGSVCRVKRFTTRPRNSLKDVRKLQMMKRRCINGWDNRQKTSMLRVSMHWLSDGTSVSVLVEYMSRNKCIFLGFIFNIHLWPVYWVTLLQRPV
jgi:hypothetical protein